MVDCLDVDVDVTDMMWQNELPVHFATSITNQVTCKLDVTWIKIQDVVLMFWKLKEIFILKSMDNSFFNA